MRFRKSIGVVAVAALFSLSAISCKEAASLGPLKEQALKLISQHSGKLAALKGQLGPLAGKIGAIPDSIPGASALKKLLGEKQSAIGKLEGLLGSAPAKIEDAVKGGKKDALMGVLGDLKGAGSQIGGISKFVTESGSQVAELEKLAAAQATGPDTGSMLDFTKTLSTGYELKGAKTGIENVLVTFLDDKDMKPAKDKWFNFDRLTFATGSANLDMGKSEAQLKNMAEILKAYSKATIKIGGYTDNTGKLEGNIKLSQSRAESVMKALAKLGVEATRMKAEGYGPKHPVCEANDTPECRAKNRRIAVRVVTK